jgi:protein SCO1/2
VIRLVVFILVVLSSCNRNNSTLPFLGHPTISGTDTLYPTVPSFSFLNQDSGVITDRYFTDKIYVADFIFLSCPTICPKMTANLKTVYEAYATNNNVYFLSHTIDPERDSPSRLKRYTTHLNINTKKWNFVTGAKDSLFAIAKQGYFTNAYADSTSPGGLVHSGGLLLVDKNKHIRGVYDGTNTEEMNRLKNEIAILLKE